MIPSHTTIVADAVEPPSVSSYKQIAIADDTSRMRRRRRRREEWEKQEAMGTEIIDTHLSLEERTEFTQQFLSDLPKSGPEWNHQPRYQKYFFRALRNAAYVLPRMNLNTTVEATKGYKRSLLCYFVRLLTCQNWHPNVTAQLLGSLARNGYCFQHEPYRFNTFSHLLFQFRHRNPDGLLLSILKILVSQPSFDTTLFEKIWPTPTLSRTPSLQQVIEEGRLTQTQSPILTPKLCELILTHSTTNMPGSAFSPWLIEGDARSLVSFLALLPVELLLRVDLVGRPALGEINAVHKARDVLRSFPNCTGAALNVEVCKRLLEWQQSWQEYAIQPDESKSNAGNSLDPEDKLDFPEWICHVHEKRLDTRLFTHDLLRRHGMGLVQFVRPRQTDRYKVHKVKPAELTSFSQELATILQDHPERFDPSEYGLLQLIFSLPKTGMYDPQLEASFPRLIECMFQTELRSRGSFADLFRFFRLDQPVESSQWSLFSALVRCQYAIPNPVADDSHHPFFLLLEDLVATFRTPNNELWNVQPQPSQSIEFIIKLLLTPPDTPDVFTNASDEVTTLAHPFDPAIDSPCLIPNLSRRSLILLIERAFHRKCSRHNWDWWTSTTWAREELCWPAGQLDRAMEAKESFSRYDWKLAGYFASAVKAAEDVYEQHFLASLAPARDALLQATTLVPDIIDHEVLPWLHSEHAPPAWTSFS